MFQYSPESFTGTEVDYAVEVCDAVIDVWQPTPDRKTIINLPATVELSTPNLYADLIEWVDRHIAARDAVVLSVHPHNDRGTAVAAAELALMAGAERVEGTLFGNGERTGNVDLVTLALNLYSQGIDPGLTSRTSPRSWRSPSGARTAGACPSSVCRRAGLHGVFRFASGRHPQRAGRTGTPPGPGACPICPIDPGDIGRQYEPIIRVNSQSGKGGIAFVLERDRGIALPYDLQVEFSRLIPGHRRPHRPRSDDRPNLGGVQGRIPGGRGPLAVRTVNRPGRVRSAACTT